MNQLLNHQKNDEQEVILEMSEVRKSFTIGNNEIEIIKGVSFQVKKGDFIIIFGPSGCGKSTI